MKIGSIITLIILSPSFKQGEAIPSTYTCDGKNINPEIVVEGIPEGIKSLAIIMDDPDAPNGTWVHWVMWNIPINEQIKENTVPGVEGFNSFKRTSYGGPCPPSGTHRYYFKVYALDTMLDLDASTDKAGLEKVMKDHVLGYGELMGRYSRKKTTD